MRKPDFTKSPDGLLPAIIQDEQTGKVLMLGYMNEEALAKTNEIGKVTFFSRSRKRLWTKGEESGNFLFNKEILIDCDSDTILVKAIPNGPVCHTGSDTCFNETNESDILQKLETVIQNRFENPVENSYVSKLHRKGLNKIAQKVGEEATELIIEAKDNNAELFLNEAADLLFHYLILLRVKSHNLQEVKEILKNRHK